MELIRQSIKIMSNRIFFRYKSVFISWMLLDSLLVLGLRKIRLLAKSSWIKNTAFFTILMPAWLSPGKRLDTKLGPTHELAMQFLNRAFSTYREMGATRP